jgi:hypothetical protein
MRGAREERERMPQFYKECFGFGMPQSNVIWSDTSPTSCTRSLRNTGPPEPARFFCTSVLGRENPSFFLTFESKQGCRPRHGGIVQRTYRWS